MSAGEGAGAVAPRALRKRWPQPFPRADDLWRMVLHIPACPGLSHAAEESSMLGAVVWPSPPARHRSPLQSPSPRQLLACRLLLPSGNSAASQSPSPAGTPGPRVFWLAQSLPQGGAGSSSAGGRRGLLPASVQAGDGAWLAWSSGMGSPSRRRAAVSCCPPWCKLASLNVNLHVEISLY